MANPNPNPSPSPNPNPDPKQLGLPEGCEVRCQQYHFSEATLDGEPAERVDASGHGAGLRGVATPAFDVLMQTPRARPAPAPAPRRRAAPSPSSTPTIRETAPRRPRSARWPGARPCPPSTACSAPPGPSTRRARPRPGARSALFQQPKGRPRTSWGRTAIQKSRPTSRAPSAERRSRAACSAGGPGTNTRACARAPFARPPRP